MSNWKLRAAWVWIVVCGLWSQASEQSEREQAFYRLETLTIPKTLKLEVSGMALLPDGRIALAIRKGEIWMLSNAQDIDRARFHLFASGLHEPLGLAWREGSLYTVQRTELTRITDTDQDGFADEYETVAKGWGVTGNYHEYAYGPVFDFEGNAWLTLNCNLGAGSRPDDNTWRGWSMKVTPKGELVPVSGGFRSPSGIGLNLEGDVFATDQQGNWFPTCPLIHIRPGVFHGHADALKFCDLPGATFTVNDPLPKGLTVGEAVKIIEPYQLPAVWLPYRKMGMSSTDVLCDTTMGEFGPFAGQLFIGEFTQSFVTRVFLEKVGGDYQGACFRFREGLQSAALRMCWGQDGSMYIGQSNRGWNSLGNRSYGLQRLVPTGEIPFEIKTMEAVADGFRLTFTKPVNSDIAEPLSMISYTYPYHAAYGGDEIEKKDVAVEVAKVAVDGLSMNLKVPQMRESFVHELDASSLRSKEGESLLHAMAYYTLNRIPGH